MFRDWLETFAPQGFEATPGAVWSSERHARTLEAIARSSAEDFYSGEVARAVDAHSRASGGLLRLDDLQAHESEWVDPISASYRGHEVWEIPPNGQGIAALVGLGILDGMTLTPERDTVEGLHAQIEAMKLGFVDAQRFVADPQHADVPVAGLLEGGYLARRRALIGERALTPEAGDPRSSGTVYLCTADGEGNMVSFIQSNYMGFGSGVVVPGTGVALQNRGHNFSLDPEHPNALAPRKRTYHTIIPGFLTRGGEAVGPFGVMGGFMQPQGHLQVVVNTLDYGMSPQEALDAPRWQWTGGKTIEVEHALGHYLSSGLAGRGHDIKVVLEPGAFGRGQIIWRRPDGVLVAGSEGRTDGQAAGY